MMLIRDSLQISFAPTHKIVKHAQRLGRLLPTSCLGVFDYFVGLTLKGLS